jgi:phage head maturation protease
MIPEILLNNIGEMVYIETKADKPEVLKAERAIVHYISTKDLDRSREIVVPSGLDLSEFKKAPTVWYNHGWKYDNKALPVAKNMWLKPDDYGVKAKTQFATTMFADDVYTLQSEGFMNTWSVGIKPKKDKDGNVKADSITYDERKKIATWNESVLLEYSVAPVACNIYASDQLKSMAEMSFKSLEMEEYIKNFALEVEIKSQLAQVQLELNEVKNLKELLNQLIEKTETNEKDILEVSNLLQNKQQTIEKAISIELPVSKPMTNDKINSIVKSIVNGGR